MYPSGLTVSARVTHGAHASRPQPSVSNPAGTARAPFLRAHPRYPSSHAGRAWKPSPTVAGKVSASHPRRPQPLSHGPLGRDSSPFRGAERVCSGAPTLSINPRRAGVEALPYGGLGGTRLTHVALNPSVTALCAVTAPLSGEPRRDAVRRRCPLTAAVSPSVTPYGVLRRPGRRGWPGGGG